MGISPERRHLHGSSRAHFYRGNDGYTLQGSITFKQASHPRHTRPRVDSITTPNHHWQLRNTHQRTKKRQQHPRKETSHLHAGIAVLDIVITIAPLLGLLGTASGLVRIFEGLGDNSDHLAIARGISEALTTTIVGLAIAVPCVVAHGYFIRRIETLTARLESVLSAFTSICEKPHSNS